MAGLFTSEAGAASVLLKNGKGNAATILLKGLSSGVKTFLAGGETILGDEISPGIQTFLVSDARARLPHAAHSSKGNGAKTNGLCIFNISRHWLDQFKFKIFKAAGAG